VGQVIVLDSSALVGVLLEQPSADWLLQRMVGTEVCAPAHQTVEAVSAMARMHRAGQISEAALSSAAADAVGLHQQLVPPTAHHVQRALELSSHVRITDGLYVALAEERSCPLLTTDGRLARAVTTCEVLTPPS